MQQVFIFQETKKMREILNSTHDDILSIMKRRKPTAQSFIEDNELCQLHDLLALLRLKQIAISDYESNDGRVVMLQIKNYFKKTKFIRV